MTASSPLGYGPMDAIHEEFHLLVFGAQACTDVELPAHVGLLVEHLEVHFSAEERWMIETDYPTRDCHISEHQAVLQSAHELDALPALRKTAVSRAFVNELANWFSAHSDYLDSALAHWICKQKFGGKPVVLHRHLVATDSPLPTLPEQPQAPHTSAVAVAA
jgi:hemerythrin